MREGRREGKREAWREEGRVGDGYGGQGSSREREGDKGRWKAEDARYTLKEEDKER